MHVNQIQGCIVEQRVEKKRKITESMWVHIVVTVRTGEVAGQCTVPYMPRWPVWNSYLCLFAVTCLMSTWSRTFSRRIGRFTRVTYSWCEVEWEQLSSRWLRPIRHHTASLHRTQWFIVRVNQSRERSALYLCFLSAFRTRFYCCYQLHQGGGDTDRSVWLSFILSMWRIIETWYYDRATNRKNWLAFGGDPVPDTDSRSLFHFPHHCGIGRILGDWHLWKKCGYIFFKP